MKENAELRYIHQDHLGGTVLVTDENGNTVGAAMKYYPYGSTRAGSVPTDKQFTGQRLDGTGLYYYGARYYDPLIGRFISADTVVPDPMNPQAFNRYAYCLNNPLKYTDPTGNRVYVGGFDVGSIYSSFNMNFGGMVPSQAFIDAIISAEFQAYNAFHNEYAYEATGLEALNETVKIRFGDLGYNMDSVVKENDGNFNIVLNSNPYRDISMADDFYKAGAILGASYDVIPVFSEQEVQTIWSVPQMVAGGIVFVAGETIVVVGILGTEVTGGASLYGGVALGTSLMVTGYQTFRQGFNHTFDLDEDEAMPEFPFKVPPLNSPWLIRE